MKSLKIWFIVVGIIYFLLGIGFVPPVNELKLNTMIPGFDAPVDGPAYRGFLDFTFMFGLDLMVIGGYLIYCSRQPAKHLNIVWLIIWLEFIRGILDDIYLIYMGYDTAFYIGFIIFHAIVIYTGYRGIKKTEKYLAESSGT